MGFAGSHGNSIFNFLRNMKSCFYKKKCWAYFYMWFSVGNTTRESGREVGAKGVFGSPMQPWAGLPCQLEQLTAGSRPSPRGGDEAWQGARAECQSGPTVRDREEEGGFREDQDHGDREVGRESWEVRVQQTKNKSFKWEGRQNKTLQATPTCPCTHTLRIA